MADENSPSALGGTSVVDLLKQDLKDITKTREVYISVAGYDKSGLMVKYRLPEDSKELAQIAEKVEKQYKTVFERNLYTIMDTMIVLCEGLYVQPNGVDQPVMLDQENAGFPVRFDERLAGYIGMNGDAEKSARNVMRKLFDNREFAIISHGEKLNRWLASTKADAESEFWTGEI